MPQVALNREFHARAASLSDCRCMTWRWLKGPHRHNNKNNNQQPTTTTLSKQVSLVLCCLFLYLHVVASSWRTRQCCSNGAGATSATSERRCGPGRHTAPYRATDTEDARAGERRSRRSSGRIFLPRRQAQCTFPWTLMTRHSVGQLVDSALGLPILDAPVPLMVCGEVGSVLP